MLKKAGSFFVKILTLVQPFKTNDRVITQQEHLKYRLFILLDLLCLLFIFLFKIQISPTQITHFIISPLASASPQTVKKSNFEVFGFAPYWTFDKLDNVDFNVLTTFSYFGVDAQSDGTLDKTGAGYQTFISNKATRIFAKAHSFNTKVLLTVTQMDAATIEALLDDPRSQQTLIDQLVYEVKNRDIDGVNIDFEYSGNPGTVYRNEFSSFMSQLTTQMHEQVPGSSVSLSVYASAAKDPQLYDIRALGKQDIQVFMMAYDFGYSGSDQVMPTSPLYGYKQGTYWYDVSTAVDDFLAQMPAEKLILGTPWYGYNYAIYGQPKVKAETKPSWYWGQAPATQTYTLAKDNVKPSMEGISGYKEGWDDAGKVGWKAYYSQESGTWRMIFIEDSKSLSIKYDFAKQKHLGGVGIWALGFDDGKKELWALLRDKFGTKLADSRI